MGRDGGSRHWLSLLAAVAVLGSGHPAVASPSHPPPISSGPAAPSGGPRQPRAIVDPYHSEGRVPVAPGVAHDWGAFVTDSSSGQQIAHLVEVGPSAPSLTFEASLSNDAATDLEHLTEQATRQSAEGHRVIAAINGDSWSGYGDIRLSAPKGIHIQHGELMVAGDTRRATFGVDAAGVPMIGSVKVTAGVTITSGAGAGASDVVMRVNQHRRLRDLVLYTSRFASSTLTDSTGTEVVLGGVSLPLTATGVHAATVVQVRSGLGDTTIGPDQVVLSGSGSSKTFLDGLAVGDDLTLTLSITAGWEAVREAVGGRQGLVSGGELVTLTDTSWDQVHPRSAIGITADGFVMMATVDGRQPGYSSGARLDELADFMVARGAVDAISLDGGGSTELMVRRPGDVEATTANRWSDPQERRISNGLLLVTAAPTGPPATTIVSPSSASLYVGQSLQYQARAHDAAWNGIALTPGMVQWSVDGTVGTMGADGLFAATADGTARVAARVGDATGTAAVTVIDDATPPVAQPPIVRFVRWSTVTETTAPISVSWPSAADSQSPVARYELRMSTNHGAYVAVPLTTPVSRSVVLDLAPQQAYRFEVRAVDQAGNVGEWALGDPLDVRLIHEGDAAISADAAWLTQSAPNFLRGATRRSTTGGSSLTLTFTGRRVAWLSAKGPTRGRAEVWADGAQVAVVDAYDPTVQLRQVLYQRQFAVDGSHTLEIRHLGDPAGSRSDVDGFLVMGLGAPDPVIVGAGDIASCSRTTDSATAAVLDTVVGTVITTGDNAYDSGTAAQFAACYGPSWGRAKLRTRPTPGNHDYGSANAAGYFGYFGTSAGPSQRGYYAYDLGTWRLYALNSNCALVGCGEGSAQLAWLRADLAARPHQCVLAYWHHARFSSGPHGSLTEVAPLFGALHAAGGDVVLVSHDHLYERFAPQSPSGALDPSTGIREFVIGTGGNGLYIPTTAKPNSEVLSASSYGVLRLTLRAGAYDWQFLRATGTLDDSGTGACH